MPDFEIRASRDLLALAQRLKETDRPLRNELLRRVRTAGKAAIPGVRKSARENLPRRGGLAEQVANQAYGVRASYAGSGAKVQIAGAGMKELKEIDEGHVRHPTFAHRRSLFASNLSGAGNMVGRRSGEWHSQAVPAGFFSKPIEARTPEIRAEIERGMAEVANKIEKGI